ncbi:MAG: efflux RND transporter periplasmic adaptor subunit, partial [Acidobacteriota bacterium]
DSLKARLVRQSDEVEVAKRQVALRLQELEDTVIRAPFAGKVVSKNAQPGEMISPISAGGGFTRTGIGTIVDMASLEIEVDVSESYINRVRPNQPVKATLDAYPEWKIPARVIAIIPTADRDKATVRVRVAFEELDPRILPDMGVKVAFLGEEAAAADARSPILLIPRAALRAGTGRDIVFVVGNGRVEQRAVTVMGAQTGEVQVVSGLSAGEKVVVEGPRDLADGDRVEEVIG